MTGHGDNPLILFDGECNLCNGFVQFVIRRDPRARFRFAAIGSAAAAAALEAVGFDGALPDSVVLVGGGRVRTRSAAALAVLRGLSWPWPLLRVLWLGPSPLRDAVYDAVARRRIRWFGRREACWVPTPELGARFADLDERRPPAG
ncbi:MAG: DCC1-like thiol-disulfide oxidoreductase family protein [Planctomycetota bacterium]|nr:DCC1-like thiol-disulfide oxidoreductase family protein [Planctomycetota bacterium]